MDPQRRRAGRAGQPVPHHRGQCPAEGGEQLFGTVDLRIPAPLIDPVPSHGDRPGVGVVVGIVEGEWIGDHHDRCGRVVVEQIVFDPHVVVGHHHDAGATPHTGDDIARGREIGGGVARHQVVAHQHIAAAHHRQVGQIEHQDAAGVAADEIALDDGVAAVLDLNPGDIVGGDRIAHRDLARLPHIDAGVRRARNLAGVDQDIGALDRV